MKEEERDSKQSFENQGVFDREEEEKWFDTEEVSEVFISPAVVNMKRNVVVEEQGGKAENNEESQDKVDLNKCRKCKKNLGQNSMVIQCGECEGWHHAHSKCGKELERTYYWIQKIEKEELQKQ